MTGPEIVVAMIGVLGILQTWKASQVQRNAAKKEAAQALSDAVSKTQQVIARGVGADATDYELTNSWHKASLAFRDANETKLSRLCQIKGNYWTDPGNWSDDQIKAAGIGLRGMRRELQRILNGR